MDSDKYSRPVTLHCSTCGSTQFEYDKEASDGPVRCASCDRVYGRDELVRENGRRVEENVDEVKKQIVDDLRDHLRRSFRGSKLIKFK